MTTRASSVNDSAMDAGTVNDLRAEVAAMRAEREELREEIGQLRRALSNATGRDLAPRTERSFTVTQPGSEPYSADPRHDPEVVAAIMRGEDHGPALRAAARRYSGEIIEYKPGQPPSPAEYDLADKRRANSHQQRRAQAEAQRSIDLAGLPVAPGGVVTRDPETGQVTIRYPQESCCPSGHPAEPGHKYCMTCGATVGTPALGEVWQDRGLREERQDIEGGYNPEMAAAIAEDARIAREVS